MANLTPVDTFSDVYQIETTDPVLGGAGGISNLQGQQLANRTLYLKNQLEALAKRLPVGGVGGVLMRGRTSASTGVHDFITAATGGLGANWVATLNADSTYKFAAAFQDGYDANGLPQFYFGSSTTNIVGATYTTSGLHYIIAVINTTTLAVTLQAVAKVVVSSIEPSTAVRTLWLNPENGTTRIWDSSWSAIVAVVIGEVTVIDTAGTLSIGTTRSYATWKPFYDTVAEAGSLLSKAADVLPIGGYLVADGSVLTRTEYPRLFAEIGTTYNTGGETGTQFRLPDYRGVFIRGLDKSRGVDTGRTLSPTLQDDAFESHTHSISGDTTAGGGGGFTLLTAAATGPVTVGSAGGTETRPKNMAAVTYIKF
jgi:microcystin-dependent protein